MPSPPRVVRIGTRGSRLARAQANWVRERLAAAFPDVRFELEIVRTSGDRFLETPLSAVGGKGLFVKEIEEALLGGAVDLAVHSMKDLPVELPEGLEVVAVPEREDPRDVLVTREGFALRELPEGARVGTSSLRRMSLLWAERYDLHMVPVRGNVETRLGKLRARQLEALVLAAAGLRRLALRARAVPLDPRVFVPAPGQGALAVEGRRDGSAEFARCLDRPESRAAVEAERAFLATAGGTCRTPIAAYAEVEGEDLVLRALIASLDGARVVRGENRGDLRDARALGEALAERLLHAGGREILDEIERPGETEEEEAGEDTESRDATQGSDGRDARGRESKEQSKGKAIPETGRRPQEAERQSQGKGQSEAEPHARRRSKEAGES